MASLQVSYLLYNTTQLVFRNINDLINMIYFIAGDLF